MERKLLISCVAFFLAVIVARPVACAESNQKLEALKQLVVEAMSYPAAKLTVEEGPMFGKHAPRDPDLITNAIFDSTDNTFYHLQILMGKPGRVLPADIRAEFDTALAAPPREDGKKPGVRRAEMPGGAVVYTSGMMGPGGGMMSFFILFPGRDAEVALNWTIPSEDPVEIENAPEAYQRIFTPAWSQDAWMKMAFALAENSLDVMLGTNQASPDTPKSANPGTAPNGGPPESPGTMHPANSNREAAEFPSPWPWLVTGCFLLVILLIALKHYRARGRGRK